MFDEETVRVELDGSGVATVTMARPEARNAFNAALIHELSGAAERLADDDQVRAVVLTGAGSAFSAGADLEWMRAMPERTRDEHVAESHRMEAMFRSLYELPKPLVGRVNGAARGGGMGLVAVCDVVVAAEEATFGFPEVRLGLAPAVVAPFVVAKTGRSFARATFVTGEAFGADRAREAGLVHHVVADEDLDGEAEAVVARCLRAGPEAAAAAKTLPDRALGAAAPQLDEVAEHTAALIAELRVGDEGQEGMSAFLDGRRPGWVPE
jgi:methylglutaconyl-CoA hydratase